MRISGMELEDFSSKESLQIQLLRKIQCKYLEYILKENLQQFIFILRE